MFRKILIVTVALATLAVVIALATTSASAGSCRSDIGGECGRDAVFLPNEPRWRGNDRYLDRNRYGGSGVRGGRSATHSRRTTTIVRGPTISVYRGTVAVKTGTMIVNRRTGATIFIPVR